MLIKKLTITLFLASCSFGSFINTLHPHDVQGGAPAALTSENYDVKHIIDGDTFDTNNGRIRIWGIDTPERNEKGYYEAKEALARMIADKTLKCDIKDIDKYNRKVGQCFLYDQDIAIPLLKDGYAVEYKYFSKGYYSKFIAAIL